MLAPMLSGRAHYARRRPAQAGGKSLPQPAALTWIKNRIDLLIVTNRMVTDATNFGLPAGR
jgi:hypothetical protein